MKQMQGSWLISGGATEDEDKRIRRTKRALARALVALTAEHAYETITIRQITERADVGYATFFRHYEGKDDLMLQVFQAVADDLETMAGEHGDDFFEKEGLLIFRHVQENEALYRSILDSPVFGRRLRSLFTAHIAGHMQQQGEAFSNRMIPLEVAANHVALSLLGLVEWWLAQEMSLPVAKMAGIYERMIIRATWAAIDGEKELSFQGETLGLE